MGIFIFTFSYVFYWDMLCVKLYIIIYLRIKNYDILYLCKVRDGMVKKRVRYSVKAKGRMFVIFIFFGSIIGTLGFTFFRDLNRMNDMNQEMKSLLLEKESLLEEEKALEADIKRLSDPLYVARYARERFFYSKEGEIILRMK